MEPAQPQSIDAVINQTAGEQANALAQFVLALVRRELAMGQVVLGPRERLHIHPTASGNFLANTISGEISVGAWSFFGHHVRLYTGRHDLRKFGQEFRDMPVAAGCDIVIGEGVWLASDVIVLGPCRIGDHAVVGAGSLVTHDIPAYAVAMGRPARVVRYRRPEESKA
jgi:acetyltransferase-like isoleucine patch superfamily enzyme